MNARLRVNPNSSLNVSLVPQKKIRVGRENETKVEAFLPGSFSSSIPSKSPHSFRVGIVAVIRPESEVTCYKFHDRRRQKILWVVLN